jgi:asparagine N-glycosylation enzyme membrane subunit Stt3
MNIVEIAYNTLKILFFVIYILVILGISNNAPQYLAIIENIFMTLIAIILIYFFNPFTKTICNDFHRHVAFSAGAAILLQLSIFRFLEPTKIIQNIKK